MRFEELKKTTSYRRIAGKANIDFSNLRKQYLMTGFTRFTIDKLLEAYPQLDTKELYDNYPTKKD